MQGGLNDQNNDEERTNKNCDRGICTSVGRSGTVHAKREVYIYKDRARGAQFPGVQDSEWIGIVSVSPIAL